MSLTWADKRKYLPLIMLFLALTIIVGCGGGGDFWGQGATNGATNSSIGFTPASVTAADLTSAVTFTIAKGTAPYTISVDQASLVTLSTASMSAAGTFTVTPITTKLKNALSSGSSVSVNITVTDNTGMTSTATLTYAATVASVLNLSPASVTAADLTSAVTFTIAKGTAPYTISVDQASLVTLSTASMSAAGTFTVTPITTKLTNALSSGSSASVSVNVTVTDDTGVTSAATLTYASTKAAAYTLKMLPSTISYSTPKGDTGVWRRQILIMQLFDNNNNPASDKLLDVYFPYAGEDKVKVSDGSTGASNTTISTYGTVTTDSKGKAFLDVDFYTKDYLTYSKSFSASYNSQATSQVTMTITSDYFPEATISFVPAAFAHTSPSIEDTGTWHTTYFTVTAVDSQGDMINGQVQLVLPVSTYTRFTSAQSDSTMNVTLKNGSAVVGLDYYTQVNATTSTSTTTTSTTTTPITSTTTTYTPLTYSGTLVLIYNGRSATATVAVN